MTWLLHVPQSLVNSHMPLADPGTSEPGDVIKFLVSGDCFDIPSMPYVFVVWEVSRMNIDFKHCILISVEVYACSAVNANEDGGGTGTASAFACVLNRANVEE